MTVKRIEVMSYGVVGAGLGVLSAIVIGVGTTAALSSQPKILENFERNFWRMTLPCLTVVGMGILPTGHCLIISLRKYYFSQASNPDDRAYQPSRQQDQQATNQPPTNHQQATNQTPTNRQLVAPSQQVGEAVFPVQEAQFTNQNQQDEINRKYKNDLIATLSGDGSFGSN